MTDGASRRMDGKEIQAGKRLQSGFSLAADREGARLRMDRRRDGCRGYREGAKEIRRTRGRWWRGVSCDLKKKEISPKHFRRDHWSVITFSSPIDTFRIAETQEKNIGEERAID